MNSALRHLMKTTLKYAWIAGLLLIIFNHLAYGQTPEHLETVRPGEFLQKQPLSSDTLVILDLDDTTITTPEGQWLGRSDMFYDLLAQEQKKYPDKNKADLATEIDALLVPVYERVPVTLTDNSLPAVLQSLVSKGVSVIAMTSRGQRVREVTLEQLERVNIRFSNLGAARWVDLDNHRRFRIEINGTVFVSHGNRKGEVLIELLKKNILKTPKQVYLIDDRKRHLKDVGNVLTDNYPAIKYTPVLCTFLNGAKPYDSEAAHMQLTEFLIKHRDDQEIKQLLKEDPFTRAFTRRCPDWIPHHSDDCQLINMIRE